MDTDQDRLYNSRYCPDSCTAFTLQHLPLCCYGCIRSYHVPCFLAILHMPEALSGETCLLLDNISTHA